MLPRDILYYYERKNDALRLRTLIHTSLHLTFNSVWLFSTTDIAQNIVGFEGVLLLVGITTASYSYYYWQAEFHIAERIKKSKLLFIHLALACLGHWLIKQLGAIQTDQLYFSFYCLVQLSTLYFTVGLLIKLAKTGERPTILGKAIILVCGLACFVPLLIFYSNSFELNYTYLNLLFICTGLAYSIYSAEQRRLESEENKEQREMLILYEQTSEQMSAEFEKQNQVIADLNEELEAYKLKRTLQQVFGSYGLTPREKEVAILLLQGKSLQQIANLEKKTVTLETVRTHRMKIYHKTGIKGANKDMQFRKKFLPYIQ